MYHTRSQLLDAHLSRPVYKHILGVPITHHDLEVGIYLDIVSCVGVCGRMCATPHVITHA